MHVGNALTVISKDQIERQQARYVTDLLRAVPGFSVSETSSRGSQTQVRVRGAEGNHILVIIDGAEHAPWIDDLETCAAHTRSFLVG